MKQWRLTQTSHLRAVSVTDALCTAGSLPPNQPGRPLTSSWPTCLPNLPDPRHLHRHSPAPTATLLELEREKLNRDCDKDSQVREIVAELCRRDVVYWVRQFVWTFDPQLLPDQRILPLDPFPKQVEFLRWLVEREKTRSGGLVCKGRGTGITWLCVAFAVHRWLFQTGYVATFGSRREDLVDRLGNMDAILPKARFLIERLPPWMQPRRFRMDRDAPFMRIMNPATKSIIAGETGDQIGRGGRI